MRSIMILSVWVALGGQACTTQVQSNAECSLDDGCEGGLFCDEGVCKCRADDHCGEGQFCNDYGNCQERPACLGNHECEEGFICNSADTTGGKCISNTECGSSVHCNFNSYCQKGSVQATGTCVSGCEQSGDCQLGYVCQGGTCLPGSVGGNCQTCPSSPTPDSTYCEYGEVCSSSGACVTPQYTGELCGTCENTCSSEDLTCLIDSESCSCIDSKCYPTQAPCSTAADCVNVDCSTHYCAPLCETTADCPNGYDTCGGLSIVCGVCSNSSDCFNGGACISGSESDAGYCACTGQNDCDSTTSNFCLGGFFGAGSCATGTPCSTNSDCAVFGGTCQSTFLSDQKFCDVPCSNDDECICNNNTCVLTGFPCESASDCQTVFLPFDDENVSAGGFCETKIRVCGKASGLICETIKTEDAVCQTLE
jgi:hypothetical protein